MTALTPSLAAKLGSIIIHVGEYVGVNVHEVDMITFKTTLNLLCNDHEVVEFINHLSGTGLLPSERRFRNPKNETVIKPKKKKG